MMQLDDVVGTTVCDEVRSKSTSLLIVIFYNFTAKRYQGEQIRTGMGRKEIYDS